MFTVPSKNPGADASITHQVLEALGWQVEVTRQPDGSYLIRAMKAGHADQETRYARVKR